MKRDKEDHPRDICERTFEFALSIVHLCRKLDETPGIGRTLGRQLLRAGTSIGANVEEAKAGQSRPDFINKNSIALKEARETVYWLHLIGKAKIIQANSMTEIIEEAEEIAAILGAIVVKSRSRL